ncbi:MAG: hypothetical protein JJE46_01925 [Acidimicrobiia bacterium]|nr:hypothetical protein [Acidimicrobiia bacterium]
MTCPDCDANLEQADEAWTETRLRPAGRCPDCGTRWELDASGLLTEQ